MIQQFQSYYNIREKTQSQFVTIEEIAQAIILGIALNIDIKPLITKIRNTVEKSVRTKLKQELPCVVFSTHTNGRLSTDNVTQYTQIIVLDFDGQSNPSLRTEEEFQQKFTLLKGWSKTLGLFRSPSGDGLKLLVRVTSPLEEHGFAFRQICDTLNSTFGLIADNSGSDIVRNCFYSYDPDAYFNVDSERYCVSKVTPIDAQKSLKDPIQTDEKIDVEDEDIAIILEVLDTTIEPQKIDITTDRKIWFGLCMFISSKGKQYRPVFHRLSAFFPTYNRIECDELYTYGLEKNEGKYSIGTFFKACKDHGIDIKKYTKKAAQGLDDEPAYTTPFLPDSIFPKLPAYLRERAKLYSNRRQRDIFLMSTIIAASSILININVFYAKVQSANLYLLVVAPPASNKGAMMDGYQLVIPVDKYIYEISQAAKWEFEKRKKDKEGEPFEQPPIVVKLIYPMNTSSSGLLKKMQGVDWGVLIFTTELDSGNKNSGESWGTISDIMRCAFHNEPYALTRNDYEINIDNPRMSILFSGTPDQALVFLPTTDNGLYSRFLHYCHNDVDEWDSTIFLGSHLRPNHSNLTDNFMLDLYQFLCANPHATFNWLEERHIAMLNQKYKSWLHAVRSITNNYDNDATIKRLGLICTRIACILTVIRLFEENGKDLDFSTYHIPETFTCNDDDFETALAIVDTLREHSLYLYENMQANKNKKFTSKHARAMRLYDIVPDHFFRKDILHQAMQRLDVHDRTIGNYLATLVKIGLLKQEDKEGEYRKINSQTKNQ